MAKPESTYFLPYQRQWIDDESMIKLIDKSRQTGFTFTQSYEDVRDAIQDKWDTWFSSSDLGNAAEYIEYCKFWSHILNIAAKDLGYDVIDKHKDIKAFRIVYANGRRITALSSSPKALRGKHGKVVLDEYAWHDNPLEMWRAAKPATTWGYPLRILSTHNGQNSLFNGFVKDIQAGRKQHWSLHRVTVHQAVEQGLYDKIKGRKTTPRERKAWIRELEDDCYDYDTFLQEYCCTPVDESTAFLTYAMLETVEMQNIQTGLQDIKGDLFVGMDIGRRKHLSVIWVVERLGHVLYTRLVKPIEKAKFQTQRELLWEILKHPKIYRCCIDDTGLGMQLAEETQDKFGSQRVEAVTFTNKVKEELAYGLRNRIEDRGVYIPRDPIIREDLHSIRKQVTAAGNIRLDTANDKTGHADNFWACALACHAAKTDVGPIIVKSGKRRSMTDKLFGYSERFDIRKYY